MTGSGWFRSCEDIDSRNRSQRLIHSDTARLLARECVNSRYSKRVPIAPRLHERSAYAEALLWAVLVIGVFVFAGLTAWDTQRLKNEYLYGAMDGETTERSAIMGALLLYLDFVNLFTLLLQLLGQRED